MTEPAAQVDAMRTGYGRVPSWPLGTPIVRGMSRRALLALWALSSRADAGDHDQTYASLSTLARDCGMASRSTMRLAIDELVRLGIVQVVHAGHRSTTTWRVLLAPADAVRATGAQTGRPLCADSAHSPGVAVRTDTRTADDVPCARPVRARGASVRAREASVRANARTHHDHGQMDHGAAAALRVVGGSAPPPRQTEPPADDDPALLAQDPWTALALAGAEPDRVDWARRKWPDIGIDEVRPALAAQRRNGGRYGISVLEAIARRRTDKPALAPVPAAEAPR